MTTQTPIRRYVAARFEDRLARAGLTGLLVLWPLAGQSLQPQLTPAPLNPQFAHTLGANSIQNASVAVGHAVGHRASPVSPVSSAPRVAGTQAQTHAAATLPASYDLRSTGRITPVKNQGACGSCWTFSAMGSLESGLLPGETWNFSENNLKNTHGFDVSPCGGGNVQMSSAYLARWPGPITETDDPYVASDFNNSPAGLVPRKHIQDIIYIAPRSGPLDNDAIKQAILNNGAVDMSLTWEDNWYNGAYHSYYDPYVSGTNHEVAVVGWDDNFDRNRFNSKPAGNGAFIVKNSWGSGWGEAGFFYISYYDANAGFWDNNAVFSGAESTANWSRVYQYDPLGWTGSYGYPGMDTAWFANVFTAQASESIGAVSFYVNTPNAPYVVKIYTGVGATPVSGTLGSTTTGTMAMAGYHTVHLAQPVQVTPGMRFSVVVQLRTPGYNYPIAAEIPYYGYSSAATANAGQSYTSSNGITWSDLNAPAISNVNVCLKAFASATAGVPPPPPPVLPPPPVQPALAHVAGDFDGNGIPDLIWQNESTRQVVVWYMGGPGGVTEQSWKWLFEPLAASGWHAVAGADFDGNGVPDLVWQNDSTHQVTVHYYGGVGGSTDMGWNWLYSSPVPEWHVAAVADFDRNGVPDLVWENDSTRQVVIHYYGGSGGATNLGWNWLYAGTGAAGWHVVAAADFNKDGVPDLVWQNDQTRQVTVHYYGGSGGGTDIGWNWLWSGMAAGWHVVAARDCNGDGVPDLVWQNDLTGQVTVHYYGGPAGATDLGWNWMASANATPWSVVR